MNEWRWKVEEKKNKGSQLISTHKTRMSKSAYTFVVYLFIDSIQWLRV